VISVAMISVICSVPAGRAMSWSRRVMRTRQAMALPGLARLRTLAVKNSRRLAALRREVV
jgi:hypothetical protein